MGILTLSAFPLRSTTIPAHFPVRFPQRNRLSGPAEAAARVLVLPASPEFWCPHVQTARPCERSFSRGFAPRGLRGPGIYAPHTPRQSHTHAAPLLVSKRRSHPHRGGPAERNHPPW